MEEEKETQTKLEEARKAFEKAQEEHASRVQNPPNFFWSGRAVLEKINCAERKIWKF